MRSFEFLWDAFDSPKSIRVVLEFSKAHHMASRHINWRK